MQYLEAMGIAMYVPRYILPAAKKSSQARLPLAKVHAQERKPETVAGSVPGASPASAAKPVAAEQFISSLRESARSPINDKAAAASTEIKQAAVVDVRFALSIWRVSEQLMVIDSRQSQEALPTQALLQNILAAKKLQLTERKPEVLNWPMFGGGDEPTGWSAARELVIAFLKARLERQNCQYLWVMGESAFLATRSDEAQYDAALGQSSLQESLGTNVLVLPSLADMLMQPSLKRITWQAIRDIQF